MTEQTKSQKCLGGSPVGMNFSRLCTLTLAAILVTCGAVAGFGQAQPEAAKPAKSVSEKKPATESPDKIVGGYLVHQSLEVGGRYTTTSGSQAMWATLVNQTSGGRILGQSLEMHSMDPSKTHFFDTLSTNSTGYGGDPYDVSNFKVSKGRVYDFAGSFRRDRNYFDYNLLANSLLTTANAANPVLVPEPDSLHLFNTVRRNTDTLLTLAPLSRVSFRAGFNHGTHEGPSLSTVHYGPDTQVSQWFRNGQDTYTGGVDLKVAKRTTLSYDQFYVFYKGDTSFQLTGANFKLSDGTPVSLGIETLATATCGSGATKTVEVVNGIANPFCNGATAESHRAPMRTTFPSEQFRFSSRYWDRLTFNGRLLYSGGTGNVNNFNETFTGWTSRTHIRQEILTGGGPNGRLASNKRVNTNGDFGMVAEFNKFLSVSEAFNYWNFRNSSNRLMNIESWTGTASSSMLTPLSAVTHTGPIPLDPDPANLSQKIESNTVLAIVTVMPEFKVSGGWRFKNRHIADLNADGQNDLAWHENGALLGLVVQPSRVFRLNLNFDTMNSKFASGVTSAGLLPTNTFVRDAPSSTYNFRARATIMAAKWINFAVAVSDFEGKNDDPLINHKEHNRDYSFGTSIMPAESLSLDFNYAHDDVFSRTDICFAETPTPVGATNAGTCVLTTTNPGGDPSYFLGNGSYDAPSNFFSGALYYAPKHHVRFGAGARLNDTNGTAEQLNPLMVPGALQSHYVTPFGDVELKIALHWAWHGNFMRTQYSELGPAGPLPSRNTSGNVTTLGVKYEF
jgi:hypothetical protein